MINRGHIKIIITVVFLIALSFALYLRRPKDMWEPKWSVGMFPVSEKSYITNKINHIIEKWKEVESNSEQKQQEYLEEPYKDLLIVDFNKQAIWIEERGKILKEYYFDFPQNIEWTLQHSTLKGFMPRKRRSILKAGDFNDRQTNPESFVITCGIRQNYLFFELNTNILSPTRFSDTNDLESFLIVPEEAYQQYINSLKDSEILQAEAKDKKSQSTLELETNRAAWNEIEKYVYMEIEKQVFKAGYELKELSVEPGPDFSGANAAIKAFNGSIVNDILDRSSYFYTYLIFNYLGENVWYAKSNILPEQQNTPYRKFNLEFLICPNIDINSSQKKKFINKGRQVQKSTLDWESKWKLKLNIAPEVSLELIGICEHPSANKQWYGPDGTILSYSPYLNNELDENTNVNVKYYEIAWQLKGDIASQIAKRTITYKLDDITNTDLKKYCDGYGRNINDIYVIVHSFNINQQKTTLSLEFQLIEGLYQEVTFENISLVPGHEFGFKIIKGDVYKLKD